LTPAGFLGASLTPGDTGFCPPSPGGC
jgi:hypothetical protein